MHVVIMAAGTCPPAGTAKRRALMQVADLVVAADGGLVHCVEHGVWPDVVVGDFDSAPAGLVAQAETHGARIVAHPSDKDRTDLELAVDESIQAGATSLTVVAVLGGRLDHELASIAMLANPSRSAVNIVVDDGVQRAHIIHATVDLTLDVGTTMSLLPLGGPADGVTAIGFRWPLHAATLSFGSTLGISNETVAPVQRVTVVSGVVLAVLSGSR